MPELRLELNSIGDANCRPAYVELLVEFIDAHIDELDDECRERRNTNPLRVLDCKNPACQAVLADAPRITDHLCEACAAHFAEVRRLPGRARRRLRAGADARARPRLLHPHHVGVDRCRPGPRRSRGGGRYDGLAEQIGGPATPGVGFGAGIERAARGGAAGSRRPPRGRVLFAVIAEQARPRLFALMDDARAAGVRADAAYGSRA